MKPQTYRRTLGACFLGYVVQAIVINFAPLLFVTFRAELGVDFERISFLITLNFGCQLFFDYFSPQIVRAIGYRATGVLAQVFAVAGLLSLAILPNTMANPYLGLLIATALYAIGGGLDEVVISPLVESCPMTRKAGMMSLLHSFYCWGQFLTVLLSTVFFIVFGIENWPILALLWAIVPLVDLVLFWTMPMPPIPEEEIRGMTQRELLGIRKFWLLALVMICGGATELCISQWASAFAQTGLGVDKTMGDLMGPCAFALLMGSARVLYAKCSDRLRPTRALLLAGALSIVSYLTAALSPSPILGLVGCGFAGFSVGILWPCALSLGAASIRGGVTLFALLAFGGDIGCTFGPTLVGLVADRFGGNLKTGILFGVLFPILLIIGVSLFRRIEKKNGGENL